VPRSDAALLEVEHLTVAPRDSRPLVADLSFTVRAGSVTALVGESGSGKSTACAAVVGLLADNLAVTDGTIRFDGDDVTRLHGRALRELRGTRIGIVLQDSLASLNPVRSIGYQLGETRRIHGVEPRGATRGWVRRALTQLGFTDPDRAAKSFPVQLSGGMRQRVCIGIGFSAEPRLVIADEPTTALDTSLQGRILRLLLRYRDDLDTGVLLVSHDVAVVRAVADQVVVLYGGRMLEAGRADAVLGSPASPYTAALLRSVPTMDPATRGEPLTTIAAGAIASTGCPFAPRCPRALPKCHETFPEVDEAATGQRVWCWNPEGTR
jgi:oligopeptide/dipeptide ABC transporter ATP-binding protein